VEGWAKCGRQYFFDRVLGVSDRAPAEDWDDAEPGEVGSAAHVVLRDLADPAVVPPWQQIRDQLAAQLGGRRETPAIAARIDRLADDVEWALARERPRLAAATRVLREREFGWDGDFQLGGVLLRGAVDRIDLQGDSVSVTDYKTGRQVRVAIGLASAQGAVYARVASGLARAPLSRVEARFLLLAARGEKVLPGEEIERRLPDLEGALGEAARLVRAGAFPAAPGEHCTWCDFRRACGPDIAEIMRSKSGGDLDRVRRVVAGADG
jgi:hypothetical protein